MIITYTHCCTSVSYAHNHQDCEFAQSLYYLFYCNTSLQSVASQRAPIPSVEYNRAHVCKYYMWTLWQKHTGNVHSVWSVRMYSPKDSAMVATSMPARFSARHTYVPSSTAGSYEGMTSRFLLWEYIGNKESSHGDITSYVCAIARISYSYMQEEKQWFTFLKMHVFNWKWIKMHIFLHPVVIWGEKHYWGGSSFKCGDISIPNPLCINPEEVSFCTFRLFSCSWLNN